MDEEIWKDVTDYPGFQVSNKGSVRSFWKKRKKSGVWGGTESVLCDEPYILPASDDGNGYLKVFMTDKDGKKHCRKIHRIVAEEFLPGYSNDDTVDHIISGPEGKLDNSVENLRWVSRRENIQKAYRDGMCKNRIEKQQTALFIYDWRTDERLYMPSVQEAADYLGVHYTTISHALNEGKDLAGGRYSLEYADLDEKMYYGDMGYYDEF